VAGFRLLKRFCQRMVIYGGRRTTPAFLFHESIRMKRFFPALLALAIVCSSACRWDVHLRSATRYNSMGTIHLGKMEKKFATIPIAEQPQPAGGGTRRASGRGVQTTIIVLHEFPTRTSVSQGTAGHGLRCTREPNREKGLEGGLCPKYPGSRDHPAAVPTRRAGCNLYNW